MRGLYVEGGSARLRDDLPEPVRGPGEVLVDVLSAGVCATDLALLRGYMGFRGVPGHEFVGVARSGAHAGRRVVGEINAACGACPTCLTGHERHCPERTVLGILGRPGAFAERLALPERNLHPVPEGLATEAACFAEPAAAAFEIAEQVELAGLRTALVLGDGRLGLLCAQVLALHGLDTAVLGHHPERGAWLPRGIRHLASAEGLGRRDLVVEATGRPESLGQALALVRPRGTLVLKTTAERPAAVDLAPLVVDEITIVGSRCGPFAPALRALADGTLRVLPMVQERFPLASGARALERAAGRGVLKVLIDVDPSR